MGTLVSYVEGTKAMPITTCVFDAYGTLFDVASAARRAAAHSENHLISECWQQIAANWRAKQLNYTWLRTIAKEHADFWQITQDALDWALEAQGISDAGLRQRLLDLYRSLDAYPEVATVLRDLSARGMSCSILSNGTHDMLNVAINSAGLSQAFSNVWCIDDIGVFKPDTRVYDMVTAPNDEVLFMSSNGWDAAGAAHYGWRTVWVNRADDPVDRLYGVPTIIERDLTKIAEYL
jgi:2-haloacid dehalogenase